MTRDNSSGVRVAESACATLVILDRGATWDFVTDQSPFLGAQAYGRSVLAMEGLNERAAALWLYFPPDLPRPHRVHVPEEGLLVAQLRTALLEGVRFNRPLQITGADSTRFNPYANRAVLLTLLRAFRDTWRICLSRT